MILLKNQASSSGLTKLKDRLGFLAQKKSKLLEYNIAGQIEDKDFLEMNSQIKAESSDIYAQIEEIENQINSADDYKKKLDEIRAILKNAEVEAKDKFINAAFVNRYIDKIYITPVQDDKVEMAIKIFTGDTVEKCLENIRKRSNSSVVPSGHTFKKMIEDYENKIK